MEPCIDVSTREVLIEKSIVLITIRDVVAHGRKGNNKYGWYWWYSEIEKGKYNSLNLEQSVLGHQFKVREACVEDIEFRLPGLKVYEPSELYIIAEGPFIGEAICKQHCKQK